MRSPQIVSVITWANVDPVLRQHMHLAPLGHKKLNPQTLEAYFTKEDKPNFAKSPLKFYDSLAKLGYSGVPNSQTHLTINVVEKNRRCSIICCYRYSVKQVFYY